MDAVPLRHGIAGPCEGAVRPLDGADAVAIHEACAVLQPAPLATALLARAVLRIGETGPITPAHARALTVGDRERLLLAIYAASFGPRLELVARCPSCHELAELDLAPANLLDPGEPGPREALLGAEGHPVTVRLPTGADQEAAACDPAGASAILFGCCVSTEHSAAAARLNGDLTDEVDGVLRSLDPLVAGELDFACPACGAPIPAQFDALSLILARLPSLESLDASVLVLARAYGWREQDIQEIPLARRDRYVAQAQAAVPA